MTRVFDETRDQRLRDFFSVSSLDETFDPRLETQFSGKNIEFLLHKSY